MVEYYKTIDGRITSVPAVCEGCWVNLIHPTSEELRQVTSALHVEEDFIRAALDPEESSRVELEEDQILMIVDTPVVDSNGGSGGTQIFTTVPMAIIVMPSAVITVCLADTTVLRSITENNVKDVHTALDRKSVV